MALLVGLIAGSLMAADANYVLFKSSRSWIDGHNYCKGLGGQLATWGSQGQYNQMVSLHNKARSTASTWVGIHDLHSEGRWQMVDGDTSYCDNYDGTDCDNIPQWAPGEPNDWGHSEDCGEISDGHGDRLNDRKCSDRRWFICEFSSCRDMVIGDLNPAPEVPLLPEPHDPVTVPGNYFVLDFASGQQGMAFFALAASNLIWMAVAVYYCCLFKQGKATYSKVAQFSEDERLNA